MTQENEDAGSVTRSEPPALTQPQALNFCTVGIGASAGGIEALQQLLGALRPDTGMAFVVILHLPPEHESNLSEILTRATRARVTPVTHDVPLEPNRVFVLPANADVQIDAHRLVLTPRHAGKGQHQPIDSFFRSLAEQQGTRAVGVLLSGSSPDGTLGIQEIKAGGGITFAQDDTARYTAMPRSAIATGAIDYVLSPEEIAHELGRIATHPMVGAASDGAEEQLPDITGVLELLREHAGVDFTQYKRNTLYRRIARRIVLHKLDGVGAYLRMLRKLPAEIDALYQDVLINVTSFFRNPEAYEVLKAQVFPALAENRSRHDPVRIWTLGCSTGEEAYSLAMAFSEYGETSGRVLPLQVFATDLNLNSIDRARSGTYAKSAVQGVSAERLRRFFVQVDGHYRIAKTIRDSCVFARHNVLTDPPFSRVDLVSCRNMLIYLGPELQSRVIPVLHYALRDGGHLWLGNSETIGSYRDLFDLSEPKHKIYLRKSVSVRPSAVSTPAGVPVPRAAPAPRTSQTMPPAPPDPQKELDRILAGRSAPPGVLITADLEIVQYRGDMSPFLAPMPGRASLNLLKMVREELVLGLRSAVKAALTTEAPVRHSDLRIRVAGVEQRIDVEAIPLRAGTQRPHLLMVLFEEHARETEAAPQEDSAADSQDELARLRQELAATREYLQSVIEQQEAANEELQSANEEIQSANEELQSINEELETSKEEVQSSNEELATVNDELHGRNSELAQTNNDLRNLLSSVQMAIVMLGPDLRIRRFTPMAERLLNLIPTDVGRPVSDIKWRFDVPDLDKLVLEVIDSMTVREREVQDADGRWHLLRVRPYRTMENKIEGAVVVLIDVDGLKRSQETLRQQTELLNQAYEPIVMWELGGAIIYWNKAAEETYGFTREQALGRRLHELLLATPPLESFAETLREQKSASREIVHTRRDGQKIIVESRMVLVGDSDGRHLVVQADRPITERKELETVLRRAADDLVAADRNKDEFLAMLGHELRNPLAPLRNVCSLLRAEDIPEPQKRKALDILDRQVSTMARLVDDLLDVSRVTLSQIELRCTRLDAVELASEVVEQNASYFAAREQKLTVRVPDEPIYIVADRVRFEQILGNLLHNASKYTQRGGIVELIVERSTEEGGKLVMRVRDNGSGISAEKLPRVFDLFMRATRSIDQDYGGLGLGLTLVKRLTELHGGSVEAHSAGLGNGSEFVVTMPLASSTAAAGASEHGDASIARAATATHYLLVDDNVDLRESLAEVMRLGGHQVTVAEDGLHALKLMRESRPEVALLDLSMPGLDGYQLAQRIKSDGADGVLLIAMSGFGHPEAREKATSVGFDAYVVKPATLAEIERTVTTLRRSQRR